MTLRSTVVWSQTDSTDYLSMSLKELININIQSASFWETLPVDINDADRIEVVKGPSSAKNLTNDDAREFYRTDNIGMSVYGGVSFQL